MKRIFASVLVGLLMVPSVWGQATVEREEAPFGLTVGMTKDELAKVATIDAWFGLTAILSAVPSPYIGLTSYAVQVGQEVGLCMIVAFKDVKVTIYGDDVRTTYAELRNALTQVYGPAKDVASFDWRKTTSLWSSTNGAVRKVVLGVHGSGNTINVVVTYYLSNYSYAECEREPGPRPEYRKSL